MISLQLSWSSGFFQLMYLNILRIKISFRLSETNFQHDLKCSKRFQNLKMIFYLIKCRRPIQIGKVLSFMWFLILKPSQPRSILTPKRPITMFLSNFSSGSFEIKPTCIAVTSTVKPSHST